MTILGNPATAAVVQIAVLAVLAWTLHVLIGYAKDTKTIATVSEEQRDLVLRPCVVLERFEQREPIRIAMDQAIKELDQQGKNPFPSLPVSQPAATEIGRDLRITNVGVGPAISVKVFKVDADGNCSYDVLFPHLGIGQGVPLGLTIGYKDDESWTLEIRYDGTSGASFFSRYTIEGKVVRDFSTGQLPRCP
jgi:hypothetical protein